MTKGNAIHQFLSQILTAYASSEVPDGAELPYLTYDLAVSAFEAGEVSIPVNMYFYTSEEKTPNAAVEALSELIGYSGAVLKCDGGYIWLKRGSPWCQALTDESDPNIKRRYINVSAEFLTFN